MKDKEIYEGSLFFRYLKAFGRPYPRTPEWAPTAEEVENAILTGVPLVPPKNPKGCV